MQAKPLAGRLGKMIKNVPSCQMVAGCLKKEGGLPNKVSWKRRIIVVLDICEYDLNVYEYVTCFIMRSIH